MDNLSLAPQTSAAEEFNFDQFEFGVTPTTHWWHASYADGAWDKGALNLFGKISLSPFALCFHYGQTVFEALKAFRLRNGRISTFRPREHWERLNRSLERMCMAPIPEELFFSGLEELLKADSNWVPAEKDTALYIRPFVIATEPRLGVKPSEEYLFAIVCTPIRHLYNHPLQVKMETHFVRATEGGVGYTKCGGNYAASLYPASLARGEGYDQLIWTDALHHRYMEESGTMNLMFYFNDTLITPPVGDSILKGITRDSILTLARDSGIRVEERPLAYTELQQVLEKGIKAEVFGVGTAVVVVPIARLNINGRDYYPYTGPDALMYRLQQELESIRRGLVPDRFKWNYEIGE